MYRQYELAAQRENAKAGRLVGVIVEVVGLGLGLVWLLFFPPVDALSVVAFTVYLLALFIVGLCTTMRYQVRLNFVADTETLAERLQVPARVCGKAAVLDMHPLYVLKEPSTGLLTLVAMTGEVESAESPPDGMWHIEPDGRPEPTAVAGFPVYRSRGRATVPTDSCAYVSGPAVIYLVVLGDEAKAAHIPERGELQELLQELRSDAGL